MDVIPREFRDRGAADFAAPDSLVRFQPEGGRVVVLDSLTRLTWMRDEESPTTDTPVRPYDPAGGPRPRLTVVRAGAVEPIALQPGPGTLTVADPGRGEEFRAPRAALVSPPENQLVRPGWSDERFIQTFGLAAWDRARAGEADPAVASLLRPVIAQRFEFALIT